MDRNANSPARPVIVTNQHGVQIRFDAGLTKREEIASRIMAGFAACPDTRDMYAVDAADLSVTWANALLQELETLK